MDISDLIGIAGLLVALAGWLYTWHVDRKVKTQEIVLNALHIKKYKEEEVESKRAIIEANVYRTPPTRYRASGWRMKIYNKGKSTAKNIRIESENKDILFDNEVVLKAGKKQKLYIFFEVGETNVYVDSEFDNFDYILRLQF